MSNDAQVYLAAPATDAEAHAILARARARSFEGTSFQGMARVSDDRYSVESALDEYGFPATALVSLNLKTWAGYDHFVAGLVAEATASTAADWLLVLNCEFPIARRINGQVEILDHDAWPEVVELITAA